VCKHRLAGRPASDWYRLVRDEPLEFEPGTKERYSNGGFVILGMIVERASLEDYYAYVRSHVCTPAGMTRTDHYPADHLPDDVAVPYTDRADAAAGAGDASAPAASRLVPVTVRFGRGSAAGGGYSTAGDLVRFARALRERRLLDAAHTEALIGPGPGGLGIAGGSPGVNALLEMSGPYTLVALANLDPPAAERIGRDVGRLIRRAGGGEGRERHLIRAGGPER
jgi:CubicO group peptidase (beta-lactamase class C family)